MDLQAPVGGIAIETKVETFKGERSQFIASLTPEDREQIFQIYHKVWGEKGYQQIKRIFSWKFERNPHLSPDEHLVLSASQGRKH